MGHDVDYEREGGEGGVDVEEGESGASGEDVCGCESVFVVDCVRDLCVDDCIEVRLEGGGRGGGVERTGVLEGDAVTMERPGFAGW